MTSVFISVMLHGVKKKIVLALDRLKTKNSSCIFQQQFFHSDTVKQNHRSGNDMAKKVKESSASSHLHNCVNVT